MKSAAAAEKWQVFAEVQNLNYLLLNLNSACNSDRIILFLLFFFQLLPIVKIFLKFSHLEELPQVCDVLRWPFAFSFESELS